MIIQKIYPKDLSRSSTDPKISITKYINLKQEENHLQLLWLAVIFQPITEITFYDSLLLFLLLEIRFIEKDHI